MACPNEDNLIIYSSDSTVCKTTYNYTTHSGMLVLAKTIVIGDAIPVPEIMCISYGHWKNWINCCDVYSQVRVNGTIVLANHASNAYETPGVVYSLQTGDIVALYVNSFYTSAQSCVNNFRISEYDPCDGVICDDVCIDYDLYSQKCVDGTCVQDELIQENSPDCGYVPPPDPCDDIVCDDYCDYDNYVKYYNGHCVEGECIYDIEENAPDCGYVEKSSFPWYWLLAAAIAYEATKKKD